jgi:hypothetical protein
LNPAGSRPVYSTLLGLSDYTNLLGIALDSSGHAYVTGDTFSADFPTTTGAFQTSKAPYQDAFVTELNSAGSALVYSTYLGGNGSDSGLGVAVDSMGDAYVTGFTCSYDFPTTPGVFRPAPNGTCERFVVKLALTPQAEVANLENTVKALVSAGTLNRGTGQLLLAPLNAALADLARGHATIAIRELNAFTFWVRLLVFFHRLTPAEGRTLIDAANSIIAAVR